MRAKLKSIRWRLPLSYVGVALVAALASGILMLITLRGYYRQRELDYLHNNARQISQTAQEFLRANAPAIEALSDQTASESLRANPPDLGPLAEQISLWAMPLQLSVQLLERDGRPLIDTGPTQAQQVVLVSTVGQPLTIQYASPLPEGAEVISAPDTAPQDTGPGTVVLPVAGSLFGFELAGPSEAAQPARSTERVEEPLVDEGGRRLGTIVLSNGPAYGREILTSTMWAWAAASLIAVAVAGMAGVWVSRRMTAPLLALTQVTERMTMGDLAARANAGAANEFGQLGRSFNGMAERVADTIHTLRRFVADAAHEINTPLTALQTNVELAAVAEEPLRGELLAQAQAQIERLQSLVAGLLSLSRVEGQSYLPQRALVDVVALTQAMSEMHASRAEQAGLNFELELPAVPLVTHGDATQLQRTLENLVDNAIKFTPSGGEVRVRVELIEAHIVVSVQDTGIGIPMEDRPLLFQRFHRGRNAASYPGHGLGLAIVQSIVEAHGGTVTLSPVGRGTCVRIQLPADNL